LPTRQLLFSLLGGIVSTFVIVKTTDVKEEHWAADRAKSNERIAELTAQGDELRRDTADANARALEAQATLAKLQAPRSLTARQQESLVAAALPFAGTQFDAGAFPDDEESLTYLEQIELALKAAGWLQIDWIGERVAPMRPGKPAIGLVTRVGLRIDVHYALSDDDTAEGKRTVGAVTPVARAIDPNGIDAIAAFGTESGSANPKALHIMVGRKPAR
jgi:hypothetical protein